MGIFIELYEARYKGGKRRKKSVGVQKTVRWKEVESPPVVIYYFLDGFDVIDLLNKRTNIFSRIIVSGMSEFTVEGKLSVKIKNSSDLALYKSVHGPVSKSSSVKLVKKEKRLMEKKLESVGIIKNGKVISYFYRGKK